jgi:hypothetical protein
MHPSIIIGVRGSAVPCPGSWSCSTRTRRLDVHDGLRGSITTGKGNQERKAQSKDGHLARSVRRGPSDAPWRADHVPAVANEHTRGTDYEAQEQDCGDCWAGGRSGVAARALRVRGAPHTTRGGPQGDRFRRRSRAGSRGQRPRRCCRGPASTIRDRLGEPPQHLVQRGRRPEHQAAGVALVDPYVEQLFQPITGCDRTRHRLPERSRRYSRSMPRRARCRGNSSIGSSTPAGDEYPGRGCPAFVNGHLLVGLSKEAPCGECYWQR